MTTSKRVLLAVFIPVLIVGCKQKAKNKDTPKIQQEQFYQELGGVQQYVEILKTSAENPVLLLIHGGPAWPQTPQFRYFNKEIAQKYTVVLWEQRGAGKSFMKNPTPGNISLSQIISDGEQLVANLKQRFDRDQIYLAGYSWGSIVGLKMAKEHPENVKAYIGIAQFVNSQKGMQITRDWLQKQITTKEDPQAARMLDSLQQGLIAEDQAFMKQYQLVSKYRGALYKEGAQKKIDKARNYYEDYKDYDWMEAYNYSMKYLRNDINDVDFRELKSIDVPIYLILGRHDWNLPAVLAKEWLAKLEAPEKNIFWMEDAAHGTLEEDPEDFNRIMLEEIPLD